MKRNSSPFKWRHFEPTLILLCVRWYCWYQLSYRDIEQMMRERGLDVDHSALLQELSLSYNPHAILSTTLRESFS